MLLHEPDRFHEVDQQHDCLLAHESNVCAPNIGSLGQCGLIFGLVRIIAHVDPARDPGLGILERVEPRAKGAGETDLESSCRPTPPAFGSETSGER